tara:strand:- start:896 stop:1006 length:111 start_codon:yes stop_codon:yes gene_type:complete
MVKAGGNENYLAGELVDSYFPEEAIVEATASVPIIA